MKKELLVFLLFPILLLTFIVQDPVYSQPTAGDCLGATPVCQDIYIEPTIFSGAGTYPNEIPNCNPSNCTTCCPNNCLDGEWNSAWYIFTVQQGGMLRFKIIPDVNSDDYDWAVFNLTDGRCEEIYSLVNQLQVSCNAAAYDGETGMMSSLGGNQNCNICGTTNSNRWNADLLVLTGQTFVLYVSNWGTGAQGGFTLDFSESTAVIFDDVKPELQSVDADQVSGCSETEITIHFSENVTCAYIVPGLFTIEGPGGPYMITDIFGPACAVGGEWEKEFTLTVDHAFTSNGNYTLHMAQGFPGVQDACGNVAEADTLEFVLDLGAPVIDESGLVITHATCGMQNGSITGLSATGQSELTYIWKNSQGAIVGDSIDLLNVSAEFYTLEIYDNQDCISYAGPYEVEESGAPDIDDSGIVITSSNYGSSTGSISGIIVNHPYAIDEYIWHDEDNNVMGNQLDLIDVPSGYYNLTVIDVNDCNAVAGPYFVGEIGGPLTVNPSANPEVICKGESSMLSPGAGGGIGNYNFSWTSNPSGFTSTLEHPVVDPEVSTWYIITVHDNDLIATDSVYVLVNQLPVPNAGEDQSIPHGISTSLSGSASNGSGDYLYFWSPVDKLEDATLQNPQTKNLYETTPFFLEIEDATTGCISEEPDQMIVNITGGMLSTNPSSFPDSVFCLGETFWLNANAGGGSGNYTYTWTSEPPMSLPAEQSFSITLEVAGTYFFYVKVNDGYNETIGYVEVRVDPAPVIDLGASVQYFCVHETVTLDAGNEGSSYLWSNGDTNRYTTIGTTGLGYDEQFISVDVINAEGCEADTGINVIFDYDHCFGVKEYKNELQVTVFPNPADNLVTIMAEKVFSDIQVRIYDVVGKLRKEISIAASADGILNKELDISALSDGVYILQLQANEGSTVTELMVH